MGIAMAMEVGCEGLQHCVDGGIWWCRSQTRVIGFGEMNGAARLEHSQRFLQHCHRIGEVLQHPDQLHTMEMVVGPGKSGSIAYHQFGFAAAKAMKMPACSIDLLWADVDPMQGHLGMVAADHTQNSANTTTDLKQPFSWVHLEIAAVQFRELLSLGDQPLLLARAGAMDVATDHRT